MQHINMQNQRMLKIELPTFITDELNRLSNQNGNSCEDELIRRLIATFNHEEALIEAFSKIQYQLHESWNSEEGHHNEICH